MRGDEYGQAEWEHWDTQDDYGDDSYYEFDDWDDDDPSSDYFDYYEAETIRQRLARWKRNLIHRIRMITDKHYRDHIDDIPF